MHVLSVDGPGSVEQPFSAEIGEMMDCPIFDHWLVARNDRNVAAVSVSSGKIGAIGRVKVTQALHQKRW